MESSYAAQSQTYSKTIKRSAYGTLPSLKSSSTSNCNKYDEDSVSEDGYDDDEDDDDDKLSMGKPYVPPPLPLLSFTDATTIVRPLTLTGENIRTIENVINPRESHSDPLFDPLLTRRLMKWFISRACKEMAIRQVESYESIANEEEMKISIVDHVVYDPSAIFARSRSTNSGADTDIAPNTLPFASVLPPIDSTQTDGNMSTTSGLCGDQLLEAERSVKAATPPAPWQLASLSFDAAYECGNLDRAVLVVGRENLMTPRALECLQGYETPTPVVEEYDLTLRHDIHTVGNIQWFYFCATSADIVTGTGAAVQYPLTVRFNLINMQKKDALYNYGLKPTVLSMKEFEQGKDWKHLGEDVCYYKNGISYVKSGRVSKKGKKKLAFQYTLTFVYTFAGPDAVYFAHCYPYTYSDLQKYLRVLNQDDRITSFMNHKVLCTSLGGNHVDMLTITARSDCPEDSARRPVVIVSARVHPGETNASYMVHGFIEFITSEDSDARQLRQSYVFKIVPMLNPDGVIHGNYRCSLAGSDLNRRYGDAHPALHPEIVAMKAMVKSTMLKRDILLYLDLHGHSKNKNAFVYGCDVTLLPEKLMSIWSQMPVEEVNNQRIFSRAFPKVLCSISNCKSGGYYSFQDSSFNIDKSKMGTGRVVGWRELNIPGSYTIEMSFCSTGDNSERKLLKRYGQSSLRNSSSLPMNMSANAKDRDRQDSDSDKEEVRDAPSPPPIGELARGASANIPIEFAAFSGQGQAPMDPMIDKLMQSYKSAVHYTKADMLQAGRDIAMAIFHFSNIPHTNKPVPAAVLNSNLDDLGIAMDVENFKPTDECLSAIPLGSSFDSCDDATARKDSVDKNASRSKKVKSKSSKNSVVPPPRKKSVKKSSSKKLSITSISLTTGTGSSAASGTAPLVSSSSPSVSRTDDAISSLRTKLQHSESFDCDEACYDELLQDQMDLNQLVEDYAEGDGDDEDCGLTEELEMYQLRLQQQQSYENDSDIAEMLASLPANILAHSKVAGSKTSAMKISSYTVADLNDVLHSASVFNEIALHAACSHFTADMTPMTLKAMDDQVNKRSVFPWKQRRVRLMSEVSIRRMLGIKSIGVNLALPPPADIVTQSPLSFDVDGTRIVLDTDFGLDDGKPGGYYDDTDGGGDGSDSDPSVDNVPTGKMLKDLKKFKNSGLNMVTALRKLAMKQCKLDAEKKKLKDEKEMARKNDLRRQMEIYRAAQATKARPPVVPKKPQYVVKKLVSVCHALPKYNPNYKLQLEDKLQFPIQIRSMTLDGNYAMNGGGGGSGGYSSNDTTMESSAPQQPPPSHMMRECSSPSSPLISPRRTSSGSSGSSFRRIQQPTNATDFAAMFLNTTSGYGGLDRTSGVDNSTSTAFSSSPLPISSSLGYGRSNYDNNSAVIYNTSNSSGNSNNYNNNISVSSSLDSHLQQQQGGSYSRERERPLETLPSTVEAFFERIHMSDNSSSRPGGDEQDEIATAAQLFNSSNKGTHGNSNGTRPRLTSSFSSSIAGAGTGTGTGQDDSCQSQQSNSNTNDYFSDNSQCNQRQSAGSTSTGTGTGTGGGIDLPRLRGHITRNLSDPKLMSMDHSLAASNSSTSANLVGPLPPATNGKYVVNSPEQKRKSHPNSVLRSSSGKIA